MHLVLTLISIIRRLKTEQQLSLKTPIVQLVIHGSEEQIAAVQSVEQIVCGVTHAQTVVYALPTVNVETVLLLEGAEYRMIIVL